MLMGMEEGRNHTCLKGRTMKTGSLQDGGMEGSKTLAFLLYGAGWCIIAFICTCFSVDGLKLARVISPETAGEKHFLPLFILGIVKPLLFALLLIGMGSLMRLGMRILCAIQNTPNRTAPGEPVADKAE